MWGNAILLEFLLMVVKKSQSDKFSITLHTPTDEAFGMVVNSNDVSQTGKDKWLAGLQCQCPCGKGKIDDVDQICGGKLHSIL